MKSSYQNLIIAAALCTCAAIGLQSSLAQQTREVSFRKSNQASKRDIGSAKILDGEVYIYHIFVSDPHSHWAEGEVATVKRKLNEAYSFITRQSRKHGKRINFVDDFSGFVSLDRRVPVDAHADPEWTEYTIDKATGGSSVQLVQKLREQSKIKSIVICLHVNKAALSYNLAFYKNVSQKYQAERMICFSAYPDGRETSSATYAHEVLHLFGAGDLYFPYDNDGRRKSHAARLFPNDVMYRVDYNIDSLNVGPFTAYRVGWTDSLDPKYSGFED